jgi:hypothetical protein
MIGMKAIMQLYAICDVIIERMNGFRVHLLHGLSGLLMGMSALLLSSAMVMAGSGPEEVSIIQRSPFIPSNFNPPETRKPAAVASRNRPGTQYEFRGLYELGGEYRLLISEARSRSGSWLSVGQEEGDITILEYDPQSETAIVLIGDERQEIQLAQMEANPTPVAVASAPGVTRGNQRQTVTPGVARRRITPVNQRVEPRRLVNSPNRTSPIRRPIARRVADPQIPAPSAPPRIPTPDLSPPPVEAPSGVPGAPPPRPTRRPGRP